MAADARKWWQRGRWYYDDQAKIVDEDQFVSLTEARRALGARTMFPISNRLLAGFLRPARCESSHGERGVTRTSLEQELAAAQEAGPWERAKRAARLWL